MKENKSNSSSAGIGFTGLLQVAFIVLKLCHVIDWRWKWVLAPTWVSAIVTVVVIAILFVVAWLADRD